MFVVPVDCSQCHVDASCEYNHDVMSYECVCKSSYQGDGYTCTQISKNL